MSRFEDAFERALPDIEAFPESELAAMNVDVPQAAISALGAWQPSLRCVSAWRGILPARCVLKALYMSSSTAHTGTSGPSSSLVVRLLLFLLAGCFAGCTDGDTWAQGAAGQGDDGVRAVPIWADAWAGGDYAGTREGSFSGVLESGMEQPGRTFGLGSSDEAAERFRVRDDDRMESFQLELALQLVEPVIRVGDTVSVSYAINPQPRGPQWGPAYGSVTIRDADDALIAWVGQSGNLQGLSLPDGFAVEEAGEPRTYEDACGTSTERGLRVSAGQSDVELVTDWVEDVGGFVAMLGRNSQYFPNGGCSDGGGGESGVLLAIARR